MKVDPKRIKEIREKVQKFTGYDDEALEKWWKDPNPFFFGKSAADLCESMEGFQKLKTFVGWSTKDYDTPRSRPHA